MLGDGEGSSFGAVGIESDNLVICGNDGSIKIELVQSKLRRKSGLSAPLNLRLRIR